MRHSAWMIQDVQLTTEMKYMRFLLDIGGVKDSTWGTFFIKF